jgi:AcrR family transcriptional regulator
MAVTGRQRGDMAAGEETRLRILRAAEKLFAAQGIHGMSLREINRAAEQHNTGAVQYHFGDRDGLIRAVVDRHRLDSEPRRHALLDQYDENETHDLRLLAAALVSPIAAKLRDPDGGREYLQVASEHYTRPSSFEQLFPRRDPNNSMERWNEALDRLDPAPAPASRGAAIRFTFVELARRAAAPAGGDDRAFIRHLTDMVAAVLGTAER